LGFVTQFSEEYGGKGAKQNGIKTKLAVATCFSHRNPEVSESTARTYAVPGFFRHEQIEFAAYSNQWRSH
jgi:hypothetical protein